jgi:3alpha(or 20beta)-hydroxysteroid dehydrogenase
MGRLDGKVALVTGATGGIGGATVARFLSEGACVMMVDRDEKALRASAEKLDAGGMLALAAADASDETATAAAFAETVRRFGGLDIVYANAGTEGVAAPVHQQARADFENVIATNLIGVFLCLKNAVAPLTARGGGAVIATASVAGLIGFPGLSPYVASKHAVIGLVKTAALELGPLNIRVNAIAPGPIENRMMQSVLSQSNPGDPESVREGITSGLALKRFGTNDEVAQLALFLASAEASYCTGGVFTVDGGYVAA